MIYLRSSGLRVEPIRWTATGRVQIRRTVVYGKVMPALIGVFEPVSVMDLACTSGRRTLAKIIARLPHEAAP